SKRPNACDSTVLLNESFGVCLHLQMKSWKAASLLGKEVEEIPLRHEHHELAMRSKMRHIVQHDFAAANPAADFCKALMRQLQQVLQHSQLVHQFKSRRMNRVTAKVMQEIRVLLQNLDFDSGSR